MSAQNSQGISMLLQAEKEAAVLITKAREYRNQKVKDARGDAAKEIEELRKVKDEEFKAFEAQYSGDNSSNQTNVDKSTEESLVSIRKAFEANKGKVIEQLLDRVVKVEPKLHRNYKKPVAA